MHVLTLRAADHVLAIPLSAVVEVLPALWIEPVEDAHPPLRGTLNWHGQLIWALDLNRLFQPEMTVLERETRLPVLHHQGHHLALICPRVEGVEILDETTSAPSSGDRIAAIGRVGDTQIQVLNLDTLVHYLNAGTVSAAG